MTSNIYQYFIYDDNGFHVVQCKPKTRKVLLNVRSNQNTNVKYRISNLGVSVDVEISQLQCQPILVGNSLEGIFYPIHNVSYDDFDIEDIRYYDNLQLSMMQEPYDFDELFTFVIENEVLMVQNLK